MTRSTRLLAVGVAVLAAALVVLLFAVRDQPDPVVVADAAPDAAAEVDTDDADGAVAATGTVGELGEDEARLPAPLEVPDGHEAVAVSVGYDAAVAALPVPGDRLNLYALFLQGVPDELDGGATFSEEGEVPSGRKGAVRALSGVEVLGVSGVTAESGGGSVTFVLALQPDDVERAIYLVGGEKVWFTLVGPDHEPVEGKGVTRDNVLDG